MNRFSKFFKKDGEEQGRSVSTPSKSSFLSKIFDDKDKKEESTTISQNDFFSDFEAVMITVKSSNNYHTDRFTVTGHGDKPGTFRWYRCPPSASNINTAVTISPSYTPTVDDIGCRIGCVFVPDTENSIPSNFAHAGPVVLSPALEPQVDSMAALLSSGTEIEAQIVPLRVNADVISGVVDGGLAEGPVTLFLDSSGIRVTPHSSHVGSGDGEDGMGGVLGGDSGGLGGIDGVGGSDIKIIKDIVHVHVPGVGNDITVTDRATLTGFTIELQNEEYRDVIVCALKRVWGINTGTGAVSPVSKEGKGSSAGVTTISSPSKTLSTPSKGSGTGKETVSGRGSVSGLSKGGNEDVATLRAQIDALKSKEHDLLAETKSLRIQIETLRTETSSERAKAAGMKKTLSSMESEAEKSKTLRVSMEEERDKLLQSVTTLKAQYRDSENTTRNLEEKNSQLESKVRELENGKRKSEDKIGELESQLLVMEQQMSILKEDLATIRADREKMEQEIATLRQNQETSASKENSEQLSSELLETQERVKAMEEKAQQYEKENVVLEEKVKVMRGEVEEKDEVLRNIEEIMTSLWEKEKDSKFRDILKKNKVVASKEGTKSAEKPSLKVRGLTEALISVYHAQLEAEKHQKEENTRALSALEKVEQLSKAEMELKEKLRVAEREYKESENRLRYLRQEMEAKENEHDELNMVMAKAEYEALLVQRSDAEDKCVVFERKVKDMERELEDVKVQYEQITRELGDQRGKNDELMTDLGKLKEEISDKENLIRDNSEKIASLESQISRWEKREKDWESENSQKDSEIAQLRNASAANNSELGSLLEKISVLEGKLAEEQQCKRKLEQDNDEYAVRVKFLEANASEMEAKSKSVVAELEEAKNTLLSVRGNLEEVQREKEKVEKEVERLKVDVAEVEDKRKEWEGKHGVIVEEKGSVEKKLQEMSGKYNDVFKEHEQAQARISVLEKEVEHKDALIHQRDESIAKLEKQDKEHVGVITGLEKTKEELSGTLAKVEKEKEKLGQELSEEKEAHKRASKDAEEKNKQLKAAEKQVNELQGENKRVKEELASVKTVVETLKKDAVVMEGKYTKKKGELEELEKKHKESVSKYDATITDLKKTHEESTNQLKKDHESTVTKYRNELVAFHECKVELEQAQTKIQSLHSELTSVRSELAAAQDAGEEKEREMVLLNKELERLAALETRYGELLNTHHDMEIAFAEKVTCISTLENEKECLNAQLERREERVGELENQVMSLEHDVSVLVAEQQLYSERPATEEHHKVVAELNHYKKKCDSLSAAVEKMLRNGAAKRDAVDVDAIHARGESLSGDKRVREMAEQLDAYKKALEREVSKNKAYADTYNMITTNTTQQSHSTIQKQFADLKQLANTLMEELKDKEVALQHLRDCNKLLGTRVQELEARIVQK